MSHHTHESEAAEIVELGKHCGAEFLCPECGQLVRIADVPAFLLGLHQRVCTELVPVNGTEE